MRASLRCTHICVTRPQWVNGVISHISKFSAASLELITLQWRHNGHDSPDTVQRKHQSSASLAFGFPAQMASNAENISIWWRHHKSGWDWPVTLNPWQATINRTPFYKHWLTSIIAWISNDAHHEMWGEITYPFPNFSGWSLWMDH